MAISSSTGFKFSYPIVAPKMETRDLVIPSSIGFKDSYSIVAPKMNMRGLVSIPAMKGVRCVSGSNDGGLEKSAYQAFFDYAPGSMVSGSNSGGLEKSIAYQAALLVPYYPGSMMDRKYKEMNKSIANTVNTLVQ